ncbi:MAG: DUF1127 domain-containing protein [Paracoccaceae bacterium]|jgi:uncharacterized protein YjiS (DUF1127 family)
MTALACPHVLPRRRRPGLLRRLVQIFALRRQRARLLQLDEHLLRDIGITADEARAEAARPTWDVPAHWRR